MSEDSLIKMLAPGPVVRAERVRALQQQAAELCAELVADTVAKMTSLVSDLEDVAALEPVRVGVRDRARQLAESLREEVAAIQSLEDRR